jgi:hypothetical protein
MEEVSQEWLDKVSAGFQYGVGFNNLLDGDDFSMIRNYPDQSANSILQFMFDTVDREILFNDYFFEGFQEILDKWLVEEDTPEAILIELRNYWMDTYAGC